MNGGVKTTLLISCLTVVGCTSGTSNVEVRGIPNPGAELTRGGNAVAAARGQLMLGSVGLALEGFRKAQRDNPYDPAALQGIGDCYSAMGRFDLAQSNYEAALALAPRDPKLLMGVALIYGRQGKTARAMIARTQALAARAEQTAAQGAAPATVKPVKVAAARPAAAEQTVSIPRPAVGSITVELPVARPAGHLEAKAAPTPIPEFAPAPPPMVAAPEPPAPAPITPFAERAIQATVRSLTVELPAAKPARQLEARAANPPMLQLEEYQPPAGSSVTVPLPPARPAPLPRRADTNVAMMDAVAPRLERLSRGEVALVTTDKPIWRSSANVRTASGTAVRWVALASASGRPNVRILNAARSQGLAASARTVLSDRGWRKVAIGDAPAVLRKSVVLYPKDRAVLGRRLAAQFGVTAQMAERDDVVLVLGRDAVDRIARPRRS
jgi:hypothetical protein